MRSILLLENYLQESEEEEIMKVFDAIKKSFMGNPEPEDIQKIKKQLVAAELKVKNWKRLGVVSLATAAVLTATIVHLNNKAKRLEKLHSGV